MDAVPTTPRVRAPAREIFGWAMFDFANQAYTLLIITVVYGDLFTRVVVGDAPDYRRGNLLWSVALALSYGCVVLLNPLCGAVMDYRRLRKRYLFISCLVTVVATSLLGWVEPGWITMAMILIVISNAAYALGEAFIASFLPDLGPREDLGWISGMGWSLGYVGGLVSTALALVLLGEVSAENYDRVRWVGPLAGVFFAVTAIPTFLWLRERGEPRPLPPGTRLVTLGCRRLLSTLGHLGHFRDLRALLVSVFFTMAGIYIIISFSFIYGAQVIGWEPQVRTYMFITVQVTAALGALGFGFLQDRLGHRRIYGATLILWMAAILAIWQTPRITAMARHSLGVDWEAQYVFLFAGTLAGLSLGSAQSAGRALVGCLTPPARSAEFFGFWGMVSKAAAVVGILGLGMIQAWTGLAHAILLCLLLFAAAWLTLQAVDEGRGARAADAWKD